MAGEAALIILDTVEALMPAKEIDIIRATLPKALEVLLHLLACNESVSIMEHLFATQRSILVKVTFQNIFCDGVQASVTAILCKIILSCM